MTTDALTTCAALAVDCEARRLTASVACWVKCWLEHILSHVSGALSHSAAESDVRKMARAKQNYCHSPYFSWLPGLFGFNYLVYYMNLPCMKVLICLVSLKIYSNTLYQRINTLNKSKSSLLNVNGPTPCPQNPPRPPSLLAKRAERRSGGAENATFGG